MLASMAVGAVVVLGSVSASADETRFADPDDTSGPLDIQSVSQGHDGAQLVHRIVTFDSWSMEDLRGNWFAMPINVLSDDPDSTEPQAGISFDYVASITVRGDRFVAEMWDHDKPKPAFVGDLDVTHSEDAELIVRFPDGYLAAPGPYEWNVGSLWKHPDCPQKQCEDWTTGEDFFELGATHDRTPAAEANPIDEDEAASSSEPGPVLLVLGGVVAAVALAAAAAYAVRRARRSRPVRYTDDD
ncbi:MAG TPA: hypothetical protein VG602_09130 [Actinomycetota bacterium]|nr:hypothetical protein [Actinomycetota bacterium]